ncbi:unnamed protein product [Rhizoctonia solani]|uniref:Uncharacterized protein n=2 Tax=Rhizoctonia solani TaxID=456999 RepID=A0A8H3C159_9AGAM
MPPPPVCHLPSPPCPFEPPTTPSASTFQAPDPDSWTSARPSRKPEVVKIAARTDLGVSWGRGGMTGLRHASLSLNHNHPNNLAANRRLFTKPYQAVNSVWRREGGKATRWFPVDPQIGT